MKRPTIADLARASGVSVSTVNRILSGTGGVRPATIKLVQDKAAEINFYGRGAILSRHKDSLPHYRLGFLLQQRSREIYRVFGQELEIAAKARKDMQISPRIEFAEDLSPENVAAHLEDLARSSDCVSLVAADHPIIGHMIERIEQGGIPVVTYITDLSAPGRAGHVGADNWKIGRTAAWFIARPARDPGRIAVFIGNHRYQSQDVADASFRSYIREHAPHLAVEDTKLTQEDPRKAYEMVAELLGRDENLVGIFIAGGGISGALQALREAREEQRRDVTVVCRDIGPETRKGLTEGLISAALCLPLQTASMRLVETMVDAIRSRGSGTVLQRIVPFDIIVPESN